MVALECGCCDGRAGGEGWDEEDWGCEWVGSRGWKNERIDGCASFGALAEIGMAGWHGKMEREVFLPGVRDSGDVETQESRWAYMTRKKT